MYLLEGPPGTGCAAFSDFAEKPQKWPFLRHFLAEFKALATDDPLR